MSDDDARGAIRADVLPARRPDRMWGGPGSGADCVACGRPITTDQLEFELQYDPADGVRAAQSLHFHRDCLRAWERGLDDLPDPRALGSISGRGRDPSGTGGAR